MAQSSRLKVVHEPSQFALEFCELYVNIIPNLYNLKCHEFMDDFVRELKHIKQLERDIAKGKGKRPIGYLNFERESVRCAYMYSYGILNASIAYRECSNHLQRNENMLHQLFSSKTLKLCCLGGGPGTEAVGVIKAIHNSFWKSNWEDVKSLVDVHVTMVDVCTEWKSELSATASALDKNSQFFYSKRVNFHAECFQADIFKPFENTLQSIINEADIIAIVNFANSVQEQSQMDGMTKIEGMIKSVIDCMSEDSCLFMLDRAGASVFTLERVGASVLYRIPEAIRKCRKDFKTQMLINKTYRLHPKTLMKLGNVINVRRFVGNAALLPIQSKNVSSCIWIKSAVFSKRETVDKSETEKQEDVEKKEKRERRKEWEKKRKEKEKKIGEKKEKTREKKWAIIPILHGADFRLDVLPA